MRGHIRRSAVAGLALLMVGCSTASPCLPAGVFVLRTLAESTPDATFRVGVVVPIVVPEDAGPRYWPGAFLGAKDETTGRILTWLAGGVRHTGEVIGPVVALNGDARERSTFGSDLAPDSRLIATRDALVDSDGAAAAEGCLITGS